MGNPFRRRKKRTKHTLEQQMERFGSGSSTVRSLWDTAVEYGENPSVWKKIRHSKFADPFRRKSVSRIGRKLIGLGVSFIPIPAVKDLVGKALDKVQEKIRSEQIKFKMRKHSVKMPGKREGEGKIKWGWKALSVEDMDRYRWKVKHGVEMLNDAYAKAVKHESSTASICNDYGKAIAKWAYLQHRIEVIEEKAEIIKELCELTLDWTKGIKEDPALLKIEKELKEKAAEIEAAQDGDAHWDCDQSLCIFSSGKKFAVRHKKVVSGVSTVTSFLVNDMAPDVFSKDIGDPSTYSSG